RESAADQIEQIGIERSRENARKADIILHLRDATDLDFPTADAVKSSSDYSDRDAAADSETGHVDQAADDATTDPDVGATAATAVTGQENENPAAGNASN